MTIRATRWSQSGPSPAACQTGSIRSLPVRDLLDPAGELLDLVAGRLAGGCRSDRSVTGHRCRPPWSTRRRRRSPRASATRARRPERRCGVSWSWCRSLDARGAVTSRRARLFKPRTVAGHNLAPRARGMIGTWRRRCPGLRSRTRGVRRRGPRPGRADDLLRHLGLAAAADLAAGLGLIAAGFLVWWERPAGSVGLADDAARRRLARSRLGRLGGRPGVARSVAMIAAPVPAPAAPASRPRLPGRAVAGRAPRSPSRWSTARLPWSASAARSSATRSSTSTAGATAPTTSSSSIQDLVGVLDDFWLWFSLRVAALAAVACWRLLSATRAGRGALWPVLVPAALAAAAQAGLRDRAAPRPCRGSRGLGLPRGLPRLRALARLPGRRVAWTVVRSRPDGPRSPAWPPTSGGPGAGFAAAALARSLGDDELEVAYWRSGSHRTSMPTGARRAPSGTEPRRSSATASRSPS